MPSSGRMALVYCYSSLGALRVRPENVTWLDTDGREAVPPWFSFAQESQRRELLTARSHRRCRSALDVCDFT
jgi:hypothetical protein